MSPKESNIIQKSPTKYEDVKDLLQVSKSTFFNYKKQGILDSKIQEAVQKNISQKIIQNKEQETQLQVKTQEALTDGVISMMEKMTHILDSIDFDKLDEHDKLNFMLSYMDKINSFTLASNKIAFPQPLPFNIKSGLKDQNYIKLRHELEKEMVELKAKLKRRKYV